MDPRLLSFEPYEHLQEDVHYEALQGGMARLKGPHVLGDLRATQCSNGKALQALWMHFTIAEVTRRNLTAEARGFSLRHPIQIDRIAVIISLDFYEGPSPVRLSDAGPIAASWHVATSDATPGCQWQAAFRSCLECLSCLGCLGPTQLPSPSWIAPRQLLNEQNERVKQLGLTWLNCLTLECLQKVLFAVR